MPELNRVPYIIFVIFEQIAHGTCIILPLPTSCLKFDCTSTQYSVKLD